MLRWRPLLLGLCALCIVTSGCSVPFTAGADADVQTTAPTVDDRAAGEESSTGDESPAGDDAPETRGKSKTPAGKSNLLDPHIGTPPHPVAAVPERPDTRPAFVTDEVSFAALRARHAAVVWQVGAINVSFRHERYNGAWTGSEFLPGDRIPFHGNTTTSRRHVSLNLSAGRAYLRLAPGVYPSKTARAAFVLEALGAPDARGIDGQGVRRRNYRNWEGRHYWSDGGGFGKVLMAALKLDYWESLFALPGRQSMRLELQGWQRTNGTAGYVYTDTNLRSSLDLPNGTVGRAPNAYQLRLVVGPSGLIRHVSERIVHVPSDVSNGLNAVNATQERFEVHVDEVGHGRVEVPIPNWTDDAVRKRIERRAGTEATVVRPVTLTLPVESPLTAIVSYRAAAGIETEPSRDGKRTVGIGRFRVRASLDETGEVTLDDPPKVTALGRSEVRERVNATVAAAQIGPAVKLDLDSKRRPRGALHLRYQYRLFDESVEDIRLLVVSAGDSKTVDDDISDRRYYKLVRRSMLKVPLEILFKNDRIDGEGLNLLLIPVDESQLDSR